MKTNRFFNNLRPCDYNQTEQINPESLRLNWNESTNPAALLAFEKVSKKIKQSQINWYGDPISTDLIHQLSSYLLLDKSSFLITNGSDEALKLICETYLDENDEIIIPTPTYFHFSIWAKIRGANLIYIDLLNSNNFVESIKEKISAHTKMIYLIFPYIIQLKKEEIIQVLEIAKNSLVIVDEAYHEYRKETCINLIEKYDNLIVTRSFSKAFGMAGLRLGYLCSRKENVEQLSLGYNAKTVNTIAQLVATELLDNKEKTFEYVKEVVENLPILEKELNSLGFKTIRTEAGFILIKHVKFSSDEILARLESKNIFVRKLDDADDYLRISHLDKKTSMILIQRMREIFN